MSEPTKLVCARALSALLTAPGTVYTYRCSVCQHHVCVAPTSLQLITENPNIEIVCMNCLVVKPGDVWEAAPGAIEEAIRTLKR